MATNNRFDLYFNFLIIFQCIPETRDSWAEMIRTLKLLLASSLPRITAITEHESGLLLHA